MKPLGYPTPNFNLFLKRRHLILALLTSFTRSELSPSKTYEAPPVLIPYQAAEPPKLTLAHLPPAADPVIIRFADADTQNLPFEEKVEVIQTEHTNFTFRF